MGDKEKSTSIHNVNFRGKGSTFNEWKIKMLSLARKKKFDMYLLEDGSKTTDKDVAGRQLHDRECGCMGLVVLSLSGTVFSVYQPTRRVQSNSNKPLYESYIQL